MTIELTNSKAIRGFLRRLLLDQYDLSLFSVLAEHRQFDTREVVVAHTGLGNVAIKLFTHAEEARAAAETLIYLNEQAYPYCPSLIQSATGRYLVTLEGLTAFMFEYLPLAPIEPVSPQDWEALGQTAGRLNQIQDCPAAYKIPINEAIDELIAWARTTAYDEALRKLVEPMRAIAQAAPVGLIHGEINPANAGKRSSGEVVLLDWDEAGTGSLVLEQGYPLVTNFLETSTLQFKHQEAAAFYRAYFQANPVKPEPDLIFSAALFHAVCSMRFADTELRWQRIQYALDHQQELLSCLP